MRERPIIFSAPMVRAILDGRKTQTRRVAKEFAGRDDLDLILRRFPHQNGCPYGAPGDLLWLREAFSGPWCMEAQGGMAATPPSKWGATSRIWYWADGSPTHGDWTRPRPSIHMPRWASRITLEIESVRIERLQDISSSDAISEGIEPCPRGGEWRNYLDSAPNRDALTPRVSFRSLWESINGPSSWDANPYVWVVSFRRITP